MKNILLPTDFSEISLNAIRYAVALFWDEPCTFYLLNVYRVPYLTNEQLMENDAGQLGILEDELHDASQKGLNNILGSLKRGKDHVFHKISDYNFFSDSVKQHIEEKNIDLIVMGTKGATGAKEIFLGTNTGDVIMKTDCNLIAVPERATYSSPVEIAFPTDFRIAYQYKDLAPLIQLAEKHNSTLRILHFSDTDSLTEEQKDNKETLEALLANVNHEFYTLTMNDFEEALNCFTQSRGNMDMIAIIARHYNFFQRLLFRPKVRDLSFHTKIPMFVLHHLK